MMYEGFKLKHRDMLCHCTSSVFLAAACTLFISVPRVSADTSFDSGVKQFAQGKYQEALTSFQASESGGMKEAKLYYYEALCNQQLKNYDKARLLFQYVVNKFPQSDAAILANQALGVRSAQPAAPAPAPQAATQPEEATVPFASSPFASHIYVNVLVNGQPITMMLDTGASYTTFAQSVLTNNNIKIPTVKNAMRVTGVGGESSVSVGRVIIQFGEVSQLVPICIQDDTIPGTASSVPLLGQSFLSAFNYEIDYRARTVKVMRVKSEAVQKPKRGASSYSRDPNAVPFRREGNLIEVTAKINGRECDMILDTGAESVAFSDKALAALGLNVPTNSRRLIASGVGGHREGYSFTLNEVQLGPIVKKYVRAGSANYMAISKPLLGHSFFEGTAFTVDNEAHVLRFTP
jgi:clan AA aspartic protease (TIGR02281 family)